jgi:hypothetical protein
MIKALASLLLVLPLASCLVGTAISATGAVVGAAVDVTGSVVGATVKTTGAVIDAATPGDDEEDENDDD